VSPSKTGNSRWPEIATLIIALAIFAFCTTAVWVGIHWLPIESAIGVGILMLGVLAVVLLLPAWFVMRVIAEGRHESQP